MRVNLASSAYLFGFSDKYPNFYIDLADHQTIKIFLIIFGAQSMFDFSSLFELFNNQDGSQYYNNYNSYDNYNPIDRNFKF